jgi:hypothetical protein
VLPHRLLHPPARGAVRRIVQLWHWLQTLFGPGAGAQGTNRHQQGSQGIQRRPCIQHRN